MAMVCLCHGVNERSVRREVDRGACSPADVASACSAGTGCGTCIETIEAIIDQHVRVRGFSTARRVEPAA